MILELWMVARRRRRPAVHPGSGRPGLHRPEPVVRASPTAARPGFSLKTAFDGLNSFPLLAVPLFILVGVMANRLGIADRLYDFCLAALGRVRGNLAYVNVGSAVGFSWMSGSALADVAGLGKMQIPQMVRAGYPVRVRRRADGVVVADQPGDAAEHPGRDLRRDGGGLHRCAVRRVGHPGASSWRSASASTSSSGPRAGPISSRCRSTGNGSRRRRSASSAR